MEQYAPIVYFYLSTFVIGFLLCIPIGPVNLEVFNYALKKHYPQAIAIAFGAGIGDAVWAMTAFFGISPFRDSHYNLEGIFFIVTAIITGILGYFSLKDAKIIERKEEQIVSKIKKKRWAFFKGLAMVMVNPLGIISWLIGLKFLDTLNIRIPLRLDYEVGFILTVILGAVTYFMLIIFITKKMKNVFNPERTAKITRVLGYILIIFSSYFIYKAIESFVLQKV